MKKDFWASKIDGASLRKQDIDDICENIQKYFSKMENENMRLRKELAEIRDEKWRDIELQKMTAELEKNKKENQNGFPITEEQAEKARQWRLQHLENRHGLSTVVERATFGGAAGGAFTYQFIPTGIGTFGTCICPDCQRQAFRLANGNKNKFKELKKELDAEFDFQEAW